MVHVFLSRLHSPVLPGHPGILQELIAVNSSDLKANTDPAGISTNAYTAVTTALIFSFPCTSLASPSPPTSDLQQGFQAVLGSRVCKG